MKTSVLLRLLPFYMAYATAFPSTGYFDHEAEAMIAAREADLQYLQDLTDLYARDASDYGMMSDYELFGREADFNYMDDDLFSLWSRDADAEPMPAPEAKFGIHMPKIGIPKMPHLPTSWGKGHHDGGEPEAKPPVSEPQPVTEGQMEPAHTPQGQQPMQTKPSPGAPQQGQPEEQPPAQSPHGGSEPPPSAGGKPSPSTAGHGGHGGLGKDKKAILKKAASLLAQIAPSSGSCGGSGVGSMIGGAVSNFQDQGQQGQTQSQPQGTSAPPPATSSGSDAKSKWETGILTALSVMSQFAVGALESE